MTRFTIFSLILFNNALGSNNNNLSNLSNYSQVNVTVFNKTIINLNIINSTNISINIINNESKRIYNKSDFKKFLSKKKDE